MERMGIMTFQSRDWLEKIEFDTTEIRSKEIIY